MHEGTTPTVTCRMLAFLLWFHLDVAGKVAGKELLLLFSVRNQQHDTCSVWIS